ncbi:MAG: hypothetical protein GY904_22355 [Planctomycetaceae bacterium]|nr:hypothetical protein [Planctomycetaceae bacterium]
MKQRAESPAFSPTFSQHRDHPSDYRGSRITLPNRVAPYELAQQAKLFAQQAATSTL